MVKGAANTLKLALNLAETTHCVVLKWNWYGMQVRKRDNGQVSVQEYSYPDVDVESSLSETTKGPKINSIPPAAMAAAAAAAGLEGVSSTHSTDSDESSLAGSSVLGPPTFGSSFVSDDDPYAWAQKLRRIPDKVSMSSSCLIATRLVLVSSSQFPQANTVGIAFIAVFHPMVLSSCHTAPLQLLSTILEGNQQPTASAQHHAFCGLELSRAAAWCEEIYMYFHRMHFRSWP